MSIVTLSPSSCASRDERVEVVERAELWVDVDVVGDVIAVVSLWRGIERRQPERIDAELFQIRQARADPG